MVQYIYIVKCPHCEDEHFDFFDEAKGYALGCLNKNPIITQVEVDRNDFGECTSHADLGTVWSWEDIMASNPEAFETKFSKNDLAYSEEDEEFDDTIKPFVPTVEPTIGQLVEMMEENEDMVECKCCENLFDKGDCYYDNEYGWLCYGCKKAVDSQRDPHPLDEAFRHLAANAPEAKELILNAIKADPEVSKCVTPDDTLSVNNTVISQHAWSGYVTDGVITDFNIDEAGNIIITVSRGVDKHVDYRIEDIRPSRSFLSYKLLKKIKDTAKELNKTMNPGVKKVRDRAVLDALASDTAAANELMQHIVAISFRIPLEFDENSLDRNGDFLEEKAFAKLTRIRDEFMQLPFANEAINRGMVEDRPPEEDFGYNIVSSWNPVGMIRFDCAVSALSPAAREIINLAKVSKEGLAATDNSKLIHCYRLASALIQHNGNNPEFFKTRELLTASLHEDANKGDTVELEYEQLTATVVTGSIPATREDPAEYIEGEFTGHYTYEADMDTVIQVLLDKFLVDEDFADLPGGRADLEDDATFEKFFDEHLDDLVEKYYQQLLDHFEDDAVEEASNSEEFQDAYNDAMEAAEDDYWDRRYEEERDRRLFGDDY